ncbi:MAG: hypothetical protein FWG88_05165 [Oscillospiraceae bacterium]|nr:hypothetical protein [Oscillospiraceae bacterium]
MENETLTRVLELVDMMLEISDKAELDIVAKKIDVLLKIDKHYQDAPLYAYARQAEQ